MRGSRAGVHVIGKLRMTVLAALLLAAGNAAALGLGQIEVKSRLNQPLLAEIPIISTTPGELEALQARLASPDTFRRVGLAWQRPVVPRPTCNSVWAAMHVDARSFG